MPPKLISLIRGLNKYALIAVVVITFALAIVLYPAFIGIFASYKLYATEKPPVVKYTIIAILCLICLALQIYWIGYLMKLYYPDLGDPLEIVAPK